MQWQAPRQMRQQISSQSHMYECIKYMPCSGHSLPAGIVPQNPAIYIHTCCRVMTAVHDDWFPDGMPASKARKLLEISN